MRESKVKEVAPKTLSYTPPIRYKHTRLFHTVDPPARPAPVAAAIVVAARSIRR